MGLSKRLNCSGKSIKKVKAAKKNIRIAPSNLSIVLRTIMSKDQNISGSGGMSVDEGGGEGTKHRRLGFNGTSYGRVWDTRVSI